MRAAQDLASRRYAGRGQLQIYPGMRCQCLPAALGAPVRCLSPGQQADVDAVNAQPTSHFAVVVRPPPSALTGALSTSACLVTSHGGFWEPHRGPLAAAVQPRRAAAAARARARARGHAAARLYIQVEGTPTVVLASAQ
jgi:hypothetical protein